MREPKKKSIIHIHWDCGYCVRKHTTYTTALACPSRRARKGDFKDRDARIYLAYKKYASYAQVGREFSLSSSRVNQIIRRIERNKKSAISGDAFFELDTRTTNCLRRAGFTTKDQVCVSLEKYTGQIMPDVSFERANHWGVAQNAAIGHSTAATIIDWLT